ncbi:MAG: hypothetical protein ACOYMN_24400 [Roseimicrobium sp.]
MRFLFIGSRVLPIVASTSLHPCGAACGWLSPCGRLFQRCRVADTQRIKACLGKAEGITVTAHKIACVLYGMIASGKPCDENEAFKLNPSSKAPRILNLQKQAQAFGLQLVPAA